MVKFVTDTTYTHSYVFQTKKPCDCVAEFDTALRKALDAVVRATPNARRDDFITSVSASNNGTRISFSSLVDEPKGHITVAYVYITGNACKELFRVDSSPVIYAESVVSEYPFHLIPFMEDTENDG